MTRPIGWFGVLLLGILGTQTFAEASACEHSHRTKWSLNRCERAISREGLVYMHRLDWRMMRCLGPLTRCSRIAPRRTWACDLAKTVCETLPATEAELAARLQSRISSACEELTPEELLDDLGYRAQIGDCKVDSTTTFAECFAAAVRRAGASLLRDLHPDACRLVEEAELGDVLPVDMCAANATRCGGEPEPVDPPGPLYCGGPDDLSCPGGYSCDKRDPLCTMDDIAGLCVQMDEGCVDDGTPVCGCDGVTYDSECERLDAGVTAQHDGPCDPLPTSCGLGSGCPEGLFCDYPTGDCGEGLPGVCLPMRAEACDLCAAFVGAPVCGCDWVTYTSDCERRAAGVAKWFDSSCF